MTAKLDLYSVRVDEKSSVVGTKPTNKVAETDVYARSMDHACAIAGFLAHDADDTIDTDMLLVYAAKMPERCEQDGACTCSQ